MYMSHTTHEENNTETHKHTEKQALQALLNVNAEHTLHVGDQFSMAGNDLLARRVSPTCWVKGPKETKTHLKWLNRFYERKMRRSNSFT